jgi:hypothetical protein
MEVLELLIDKLPKVQRALGLGYQDEQQLLTTMRRACQTEDMFALAIFANKLTYSGLCDDLQAACSYDNDRKAMREREQVERQQQQFVLDAPAYGRTSKRTIEIRRRLLTIRWTLQRIPTRQHPRLAREGARAKTLGCV